MSSLQSAMWSTINGECHFIHAMKQFQPYDAKMNADAYSLMPLIVYQAMNHDNHVLALTPAIYRSMC